MEFEILYESIYAVLSTDTSVQPNVVAIVGTAFVIKRNPLLFLTCNHVVSQGNSTAQAGEEGIRFLLVSGKPLREPVRTDRRPNCNRARELRDWTFIKSG
jgi:hypothetical protein